MTSIYKNTPGYDRPKLSETGFQGISLSLCPSAFQQYRYSTLTDLKVTDHRYGIKSNVPFRKINHL